MRMRLGLTVLADIPMDIEIGDHAARDEFLSHEVTGQCDALGLGHLARKGELDFARQLRVLALFECLDIVPQPLAVREMFGRAVGQHDLAVHDAGLVGEVMGAIEPLVVQLLGGAIGGCRDSATPAGAADDLHGEMENCHDGNPSTPLEERQHDV